MNKAKPLKDKLKVEPDVDTKTYFQYFESKDVKSACEWLKEYFKIAKSYRKYLTEADINHNIETAFEDVYKGDKNGKN